MKMIPTNVHGILDYVTAAALFFAPSIFGFAEVGGAAVAIPQSIAALILLQSLMTDYEFGLFKVLPMKAHLGLDYVASLFLATSPFLFNFTDAGVNAWLPHVVVGAGYFVATMLTETEPERSYSS